MERAKELDCLYEVEQALSQLDLPLDRVFRRVVEPSDFIPLLDRVMLAGTCYSRLGGKSAGLFLANQGAKKQRLEKLLDAITEVYASLFGPDPITYRTERGLLDFDEEMAILIQEVVGRRVGDYFMPSFAGVAFSRNEFRWSPRIRREDGLIRMVPGLGTRAVDRVTDDYPVLAVPRKPHLRVNTTIDEIIRYSPTAMDVINLKEGSFETIQVQELLQQVGADSCGPAS